MQSETLNKKQLEPLAKEMAKGVKTGADLAEVTNTLTKTLIETALKAEPRADVFNYIEFFYNAVRQGLSVILCL